MIKIHLKKVDSNVEVSIRKHGRRLGWRQLSFVLVHEDNLRDGVHEAMGLAGSPTIVAGSTPTSGEGA